MIDLRFLRENPEIVKQNIRNKFQDSKLPLVDEVIALDEELRQNKKRADDLRANRNKISKSIGALMGQKKFEEAEEAKKIVAEQAAELAACEAKEAELSEKIQKIMMIQRYGPRPKSISQTSSRLFRSIFARKDGLTCMCSTSVMSLLSRVS